MAAWTRSDRWNPFSWRAAELARLAGDPEHEARRAQLLVELLLAEASEVAGGARHLSVVHGAPATVPQRLHVDAFYAEVDRLTAQAKWRRRRVEPDHIIVAVAGPGADTRIDQIYRSAQEMNPGHWRVRHSACPDLA